MRDAAKIRGHRGKKHVKTLPPEDVPALLERLKRDPIAVERELDDMVFWMVCTGDRIGNMLAADWSYLNLVDGIAHLQGVAVEHNGVMSIEFDSSKSNDRYIDLPSQFVTALQALWLERDCPESGFVFPGKRGNPRGLGHLHKSMREAFTRAGFSTLKPHSFRRTTATELSSAGVSDFEIAAYLGHDDVQTTRQHYLRKRERSETRRAALDALVGAGDPRSNVTALHGRSQAVGE